MSLRENLKKRKGIYLGTLFVILQILIITRNYFDNYFNLFWLCDITAIFIAIGFFSNNHKLVRGILNILLIPQLIYIVAFATRHLIIPHLSKIHPFIANLYKVGFVSRPAWFIASALLLHFTGLIALYYTIKKPYDRQSLKYSFWILVVIYVAMVLFTEPVENINFAFTFSHNALISLIWIPLTYVIVVIPTYYLQKWFYERKFKKKA